MTGRNRSDGGKTKGLALEKASITDILVCVD